MRFIRWFASNTVIFLNKNVELRLLLIKITKKIGLYNKMKSLSHKMSRLSFMAYKEKNDFLQSDESQLSPQAKRVYLLLKKNIDQNKEV